MNKSNDNRLFVLRFVAVAMAMVAYAFLAASFGGAIWRFVENFVTTIAAIYTAYKLIIAGRSFLSVSLAAACLGIGANAMIEATLYLNDTYVWWRIGNVGPWYQFGNHLRNPVVIAMALVLTGVLHTFAAWLESTVNE